MSVLADNFEKPMNTIKIRYVQFRFIGLWLMACLVALPAYADLQIDAARAIILAAKADTSLTDHEKLFVYRCETVTKYLGFPDTPTGKATKYSCDVPAIGIAFYAGKDLGKHPPEKIAQYFIDELAKHNLTAQVFIKHDHEYGSSMGFYINGKSWLAMPRRPSEAVKMIESLAAETKLILFTKGRIKEWPKSIK